MTGLMMTPPKYFKQDRIVRDAVGKPIGRVVLPGDFKMGTSIAVAILTVPKALQVPLVGTKFYVDGEPYQVPEDLPKVKFTTTIDKLMVSNFFLDKVE